MRVRKCSSGRRKTRPPGTSFFHINEALFLGVFFLFLLATAGVNHHVCLWNPYVISKPVGVSSKSLIFNVKSPLYNVKEFIFSSTEMTILVTLLRQNRPFFSIIMPLSWHIHAWLAHLNGSLICVNVRPFLPMSYLCVEHVRSCILIHIFSQPKFLD